MGVFFILLTNQHSKSTIIYRPTTELQSTFQLPATRRQSMNTVLSDPVELHLQEIASELSIKPGSHLEDNLENLLSQVTEIAKPKSIHRVSYVEARGLDTVTIETTTFQSSALRANLDQIGRIFPFVATCGIEVEHIPIEPGDLLSQYWLNTIKLFLLRASLDHLRKTLQKHYKLKNLSAMNPGSGEASVWPIEEQGLLFSLFGGPQIIEQQIGVQLLPSFLMVPEMSVSGILFPSETDYTNCQLCQRADCPGRRAHFDAELWESIHNQ
jgi:hypothetical protein